MRSKPKTDRERKREMRERGEREREERREREREERDHLLRWKNNYSLLL